MDENGYKNKDQDCASGGWNGSVGAIAIVTAVTDEEFYFVEETFMGRTALLDAFAQSDLDMAGFRILNCANFGTVTSVGLGMPLQFSVVGSPVTDSGVITVGWASDVPAGPGVIPPIPFGVLPFAVGVGAGHQPGLVPDPGPSGNPTDYLGRDMSYRPAPSGGMGGNPYPYEPFVPNPVLSIGAPTSGPANESIYQVTAAESLTGVALFYSVNNSGGGFQPLASPFQFNLYSGQVGYVYGAKIGYQNSAIIFVQAPPAPGGEVVTGDDGLPITGDDGLNVTVGP